ncbi:toprim domain-containing protein [Deinococcus sp. Marseille-Q6407]|uniref:toprim domain-containing protein n=1 Tax=Deinococcus sp. Marseille-Q6407 TaxID=2969223 RepID=UPI0021BFBD08|nr:toprim domain-containing protein [Deinococcus sp. Marseille-Q6407]
MKTLVIVESPSKAKTLRGYLGPDYIVEASVGHIRDLPRKADELPERYRSEPWANTGINPDGYKPVYIISPDKTELVSRLQTLAGRCDRVLFATDDDREGEAISWGSGCTNVIY